MWPHLSNSLRIAISARKTPDAVYGPATIKLGPETADVLCEGEFMVDLAGATESLLKVLGVRMEGLLHG